MKPRRHPLPAYHYSINPNEECIIDAVMLIAPGRYNSDFGYEFVETVITDAETTTRRHMEITGFKSAREALNAAQLTHEQKCGIGAAYEELHERRGNEPLLANGKLDEVQVGADVIAQHPESNRFELGDWRGRDDDGLHVILFDCDDGVVQKVKRIVAAVNYPGPTLDQIIDAPPARPELDAQSEPAHRDRWEQSEDGDGGMGRTDAEQDNEKKFRARQRAIAEHGRDQAESFFPELFQ